MDPAAIKMEGWQGREEQGTKVILRAGEILYRIKR
jgi:hypothetical protein